MTDTNDYSRGYAAGRKFNEKKADAHATQVEKNKLWNQAFLTALPGCIEASGWERGGKAITGLADRVKLARDFADEALKYLHVPIVSVLE